MGPHFNKSSAVITWQNANFALYCLYGRAVSTYISVSEVITVLIKYYVCKCPSCTRHQYISNHNIEAVKFASYPCLWASWESSSKKTFIGLVLENETEKLQYTFFFSLNIMFADALVYITWASRLLKSLTVSSSVCLGWDPKKLSKLCITCWPLCEGNPLVTSGFPSQRASNADSLSMSCHHHDKGSCQRTSAVYMWWKTLSSSF